MDLNLKNIKYNDSGLIPAIIQDYKTNDVLMMAYMNNESLNKTIESGETHFYSRSRKKLWRKGETSGHIQIVKDILIDCDSDTLLIKVEQVNNACHTGNRTCFFNNIKDGYNLKSHVSFFSDLESSTHTSHSHIGGHGGNTLEKVYRKIIDRRDNPKSESYVSSLFKDGQDKILKKIGEEGSELIIGSKNDVKEEIVYETADLLFHTLVLLCFHGISIDEIYDELKKRYNKPSHFYRKR